jgi:anti-sigma regulatory factor (Ser/Thr protein kinase)
MRPPVEVALCLPPKTPLAVRLHRLGAKRFLPLYDTLPQARTAVIGGLVLTDQLQQELPPEPQSAKAARRMVADACQAWRLTQLSYPAQLVVSELAANAIRHAGTDMLVTVSRRGSGLNITVRDGSPLLPRLRPSGAVNGPLREGGRGLQIVQGAAAAWGALPTHDGDGKVVWATLR